MVGQFETKSAVRHNEKLWSPLLPVSFFLIELFSFLYLQEFETPLDLKQLWPLAFGALWAVMLWSICRMLPGKAGRVVYGIAYFIAFAYAAVQTGYYLLFSEMMWLSDFRYASEGSDYFSVLLSYPVSWWLCLAALLGLGVLCILKFPVSRSRTLTQRIIRTCVFGVLTVLSIAGCFLLPNIVFLADSEIRYAGSDYGRMQSSEAVYTNMFNAHRLYQVCGIYQTGVKDLYRNEIFPLSPTYAARQGKIRQGIGQYFDSREAAGENEMTGLLEGKNVILVLMESMDDWMLGEHTPTINRMMSQGINFTNFYTPPYGGVRTFNTEFCINTGSFLSCQGGYAFDYVTNHFNQSLASLLTKEGYTAKTFHYNDPSFYSRGVFSPAMGYEEYVCYEDYISEEDSDLLYDDCLLFDNQELNELFFREGKQRFNFVITRSAHLSYVYNEVLSHWGLKKYPEFRGMTENEEEDCAYLKAKLVDDFFARMLMEIESREELDNTVIIGVTDHYSYGVKDEELLLARSGVAEKLLLEKTPCFIWGAGVPAVEVDKTLNTSDIVPTLLNLLGVHTDYRYIGNDAFDPNYVGYALFSEGSWVTGNRAYDAGTGEFLTIPGAPETTISDEEMGRLNEAFVAVNNQILETDFYR